MKNRSFVRHLKSWYADQYFMDTMSIDNTLFDSIDIGFNSSNMSPVFTINFHNYCGKIIFGLESSSMSWKYFPQFKDLIEMFSDMGDKCCDMSVDEFCEMLISMGIEDSTEIEKDWE